MTISAQRIPDVLALTAAQRVLERAGHVADPFASAEIFSAEAYTGEDFWRFERWALFEREWLCIGHANQVPERGDHLAITIIGESLVIARDDAGDVRVLTATGLAQIRHTVFHGLIFINFDGDAPQLTPRLSKLEAMIDDYRLAELVPTPTSRLETRSNWKIYQENALEPYHTDVVHRTSHRAAPASLSTFYDYVPGDGAIMTTTGFADAEELFASGSQTRLPGIEGLSDEQRQQVLFVAVLPVLFLVLEPGSVIVNLVLPEGATAMTRSTFALYPRTAATSPAFADALEEQRAALSGIITEDLITQEALQRGHGSRFTPKGTLSWLEATIPQMNGWLRERYQRAFDTAKANLLPQSA